MASVIRLWTSRSIQCWAVQKLLARHMRQNHIHGQGSRKGNCTQLKGAARHIVHGLSGAEPGSCPCHAAAQGRAAGGSDLAAQPGQGNKGWAVGAALLACQGAAGPWAMAAELQLQTGQGPKPSSAREESSSWEGTRVLPSPGALTGASPQPNCHLSWGIHVSCCSYGGEQLRAAWCSWLQYSLPKCHTEPGRLLSALQQKASEALQVPRLILCA